MSKQTQQNTHHYELEDALYRAKALSSSVAGPGLDHFLELDKEHQDGLLWLLREEIQRASDCYQAMMTSRGAK